MDIIVELLSRVKLRARDGPGETRNWKDAISKGASLYADPVLTLFSGLSSSEDLVL